MVKRHNIDGKECYRCEECLLYYTDKKLAEKCEEWCKEYKSCNLKLTKYALKINRRLEKYEKS